MPTTMQGTAASTKLAKLRAHALFGELGLEVTERLAACANIKRIAGGTTIRRVFVAASRASPANRSQSAGTYPAPAWRLAP